MQFSVADCKCGAFMLKAFHQRPLSFNQHLERSQEGLHHRQRLNVTHLFQTGSACVHHMKALHNRTNTNKSQLLW